MTTDAGVAVMLTREEAETQIRSAPRRVHIAVRLSLVLAGIILVRGAVAAFAGDVPPGKALGYALALAALLPFEGFVGLYSRNRSAYVIIAILALLPVLGSLAQLLHAAVVLASGRWTEEMVALIRGLVSFGQLVVTATLLSYLFSREVREYVWRKQDSPIFENRVFCRRGAGNRLFCRKEPVPRDVCRE